MHISQWQRWILWLEAAGFLSVISILWLDELLDLPHRWFGFQATPVNWVEGLIESSLVLACAVLVMAGTCSLTRRLRQLQGLLHVCSHCRRVRDDQGRWRQIEAYVRDHSSADFSHGVCPDCLRKHYGEFIREEVGGLDRENHG